ncbi:hypothetical protein L195_g020660, partial [Trifolium pratense]
MSFMREYIDIPIFLLIEVVFESTLP